MDAFRLAGPELSPFATAALQVLEIGPLFLRTCVLHWQKGKALIGNFIAGQDTSRP